GGFYRNFTTAASKVVVGYSFQIAGAVGANNVKFFNIGVADGIHLSTQGEVLYVNGAATSFTFIMGAWYYIEVEIDKGAGEGSVYVDGVLITTVTTTLADSTYYAFGANDVSTAPYGR